MAEIRNPETPESRLAVEPDRPRVEILGVQISVGDSQAAVDRLAGWITGGRHTHVCVSDVNALLNASRSPRLTAFYNTSGMTMTLADGMPLVWAGRRAGVVDMQRVCGPDFMPVVLARSAQEGWSNYFLGGDEGVAERLAEKMSERFPGLSVAGYECPPFRQLDDAEKAEQIGRINDSGAQIVWVCLGAPRQELWMEEMRPHLKANVLVGVGAAFNFLVGDVRRAPAVLQKAGLEWAYRICQEPGRLWRRYAMGIPQYLGGVAMHRPRIVTGAVPSGVTLDPVRSEQTAVGVEQSSQAVEPPTEVAAVPNA